MLQSHVPIENDFQKPRLDVLQSKTNTHSLANLKKWNRRKVGIILKEYVYTTIPSQSGDCLFACLKQAWNSTRSPSAAPKTTQNIREWLSIGIHSKNIIQVLRKEEEIQKRLEPQIDTWPEKWMNPHKLLQEYYMDGGLKTLLVKTQKVMNTTAYLGNVETLRRLNSLKEWDLSILVFTSFGHVFPEVFGCKLLQSKAIVALFYSVKPIPKSGHNQVQMHWQIFEENNFYILNLPEGLYELLKLDIPNLVEYF